MCIFPSKELFSCSIAKKYGILTYAAKASPFGGVQMTEINKFIAIHLTQAKDRLENRKRSCDRKKNENPENLTINDCIDSPTEE